MNPSDTPSTQEWFNGIPDPNLPPSPEPLGQPPSRKKWVIFTVIGVVLFITVSAIGFGAYTLLSAKKCLSSDDYTMFYNTQPEDKSAVKNSFYTGSLQFTNGTTAYVEPDSAQKELKKIVDFYNSRSSSVSIIIKVASDYTASDNEQTATKRIAAVKNTLVKAGVSEKDIQIEQPSFIDTSDELSEDSDELASSTTYVSISSDKKCHQ